MLWPSWHCGLGRCLIRQSEDLSYVGQYDFMTKLLNKGIIIAILSLNICIHSKMYPSKSTILSITLQDSSSPVCSPKSVRKGINGHSFVHNCNIFKILITQYRVTRSERVTISWWFVEYKETYNLRPTFDCRVNLIVESRSCAWPVLIGTDPSCILNLLWNNSIV